MTPGQIVEQAFRLICATAVFPISVMLATKKLRASELAAAADALEEAAGLLRSITARRSSESSRSSS